MPKCRSCGAEIHFITTKNGKYMPVNTNAVYIEIDPYGPDTFITRNGEIVRGRVTTQAHADTTASIPHWKDCPGANTHRRR